MSSMAVGNSVTVLESVCQVPSFYRMKQEVSIQESKNYCDCGQVEVISTDVHFDFVADSLVDF